MSYTDYKGNSTYKDYTVFNKEQLFTALSKISDTNKDIEIFYDSFKIDNVLKDNLARTNSNFVFKNRIKEDTTKSTITQALNKLHHQNINKVVSMITVDNIDRIDAYLDELNTEL